MIHIYIFTTYTCKVTGILHVHLQSYWNSPRTLVKLLEFSTYTCKVTGIHHVHLQSYWNSPRTLVKLLEFTTYTETLQDVNHVHRESKQSDTKYFIAKNLYIDKIGTEMVVTKFNLNILQIPL